MDYQGPLPDVSGDALRYLAQYHQRYSDKPTPTIDPRNMAMAAENTFRHTGTTVPDALALSQAQRETEFGTLLADRYRKLGGDPYKNPFNIGVQDHPTKITYFPHTQQEGIQRYYDTIANHYLKNKTMAQLLQNFVNTNNQRYASDKTYEAYLQEQVPRTERRMK